VSPSEPDTSDTTNIANSGFILSNIGRVRCDPVQVVLPRELKDPRKRRRTSSTPGGRPFKVKDQKQGSEVVARKSEFDELLDDELFGLVGSPSNKESEGGSESEDDDPREGAVIEGEIYAQKGRLLCISFFEMFVCQILLEMFEYHFLKCL
jgi:hypothetical protein